MRLRSKYVTRAEVSALNACLEALWVYRRPLFNGLYLVDSHKNDLALPRLCRLLQCYIRDKTGQNLSIQQIVGFITNLRSEMYAICRSASSRAKPRAGKFKDRQCVSRAPVLLNCDQPEEQESLESADIFLATSLATRGDTLLQPSASSSHESAGSNLSSIPSESNASPHSSMSRRRLAMNKPVLLCQVSLPPLPSFSTTPTPLTSSAMMTKLRTPNHTPLCMYSYYQFPFASNETGFIFPITPANQVASTPLVPPRRPPTAPRRSSWLSLVSQKIQSSSGSTTSPIPFLPLVQPIKPQNHVACHQRSPVPAITDCDSSMNSADRTPAPLSAVPRFRIPNAMPLACRVLQTPPSRPRASLGGTRIGLPRRLSYNRYGSSPQLPSNEATCSSLGLGSPVVIPGSYIHTIPSKRGQVRTAPNSGLTTPVHTPETKKGDPV
ncbi:hypothetical protein OBBRIDRAFT_614183 [Obba rivulosa]|uniref:Uncharacterized protein n=1 Tax=Obba rivulosa TaxID=1052685 RepID=A0A8E2DSY3_9APHY|nr:hypothetical protein OBBRIDRAFT_614183 [Obba rivulosa]